MHSRIYGGRNNRNSGSSESTNGDRKNEITIDPSFFEQLETDCDIQSAASPINIESRANSNQRILIATSVMG